MPNDLIENPYLVNEDYVFEFENGETHSFNVSADLASKEMKFYSEKRYKWAELDFQK